MDGRHVVGWAAVVICGLVSEPLLWACQRLEGTGTAKEITRKSEVIVRAQVVGTQPPSGDAPGQVELHILEVLKGDIQQTSIVVSGQATRYDGPNDGRPPYDFVRPGGRHGDCFARDYRVGAQYLLFLKNGTPYWSALAATNEEVMGGNDPWVWWVKGYLAEVEQSPGNAAISPLEP